LPEPPELLPVASLDVSMSFSEANPSTLGATVGGGVGPSRSAVGDRVGDAVGERTTTTVGPCADGGNIVGSGVGERAGCAVICRHVVVTPGMCSNPPRHSHVYELLASGRAAAQTVAVGSHTCVPTSQGCRVGAVGADVVLGAAVGVTVGVRVTRRHVLALPGIASNPARQRHTNRLTVNGSTGVQYVLARSQPWLSPAQWWAVGRIEGAPDGIAVV
jgi:hypothetical protein